MQFQQTIPEEQIQFLVTYIFMQAHQNPFQTSLSLFDS